MLIKTEKKTCKGLLFNIGIMSAKQLNNYPSIFLKRSIIELVVKFLF